MGSWTTVTWNESSTRMNWTTMRKTYQGLLEPSQQRFGSHTSFLKGASPMTRMTRMNCPTSVQKRGKATSIQNGPDCTDDTSHLSNEIPETWYHLTRLRLTPKGTLGSR